MRALTCFVVLLAASSAYADDNPVSGASPKKEPTKDWVPPTKPGEEPPPEPRTELEGDAEGRPPEGSPEEWGVDGPYSLDILAIFGTGRRLDDPPVFDVTERQGLLFGAGLDVFLSRRVSFGVHFEHFDLGAEESGLLPGGIVFIDRDLNSLWGSLKLYPLRNDTAGLFMRIGLGAAWQSADLSGEVWPVDSPSMSVPIDCEGSDSLGFGVRGDAGVDLNIGGGVRFQGGIGVDGLRLSDTVLDGCVPGAGTSTVLSVRSAFLYGWEIE